MFGSVLTYVALRLLGEAADAPHCAAGRAFLFESPAASGRYPKYWDLSRVAQMIQRTNAVILPVSMCMFQLSPADQPASRYRKNTWLLVHPRLLPAALSLRRRCDGQHEPLEGTRPGTGVKRTQEAAAYTPSLPRQSSRSAWQRAPPGARRPTRVPRHRY